MSLMFLALWRKFFDPLFGALAFPVILGVYAGSSIVAHLPESIGVGASRSPLVITLGHVIPVLIAEACLVGVVVICIAQLIQERRLKNKASMLLFLSGPSLMKLQVINSKILTTGFAAISFAIVAALVWAFANGTALTRPDLLQLSGYLTWGCFAGMFALHSRSVYSQRQMAIVFCLIASFAFLGLFSAHSWLGLPLHRAVQEAES
jgi:hypothetical protein